MTSGLRGIIDRVEGEFAVIKLAGEQELYWPKNNISFNFDIGDTININLSREDVVPADEDGAKNILRKIFQPNVQTE